MASALHATGEGGISPSHLQGGDLVWQIGTGYFGCRDERGRFSLEHLLATLDGSPVRSIEIKLSQGAKPGLGGLLPGGWYADGITRTACAVLALAVLSPACKRKTRAARMTSPAAGVTGVSMAVRMVDTTGSPFNRVFVQVNNSNTGTGDISVAAANDRLPVNITLAATSLSSRAAALVVATGARDWEALDALATIGTVATRWDTVDTANITIELRHSVARE